MCKSSVRSVSDNCPCSGMAKYMKTWDFRVKTSVLLCQNFGFFEPCCTSAETIKKCSIPHLES